MIKARVLLHPIIPNNKSRLTFFLFSVTIMGIMAFLWWRVAGLMAIAEVSINVFRSPQAVPLLSLLTSPYIQILIVLCGILAATVLTSTGILGPIKRIEQWLLDWEMGHSLSPLQSRNGDAYYDNLIRLINDLYLIKKSNLPSHKSQN